MNFKRLEKKQFIKFVLTRFAQKKRESHWILEYITCTPDLLDRVEFVEEARNYDRGIVMSTVGSPEIPFRYYKGNVMTADEEKTFHDVRQDKESKFYIQVNYPNRDNCPYFLRVVYETITDDITPETEKLLAEIKMFHMEQYINEALDNNDKELFYKLIN